MTPLEDMPLFAVAPKPRYEECVDTPSWYGWMANFRMRLEHGRRTGLWRNPLTGRAVAVDIATGRVRQP